MNYWNGLVKLLWIEYLDKNGTCLWKKENLFNILHRDGEELILKVMFGGQELPSNYYFGLDNRTTLDVADNMEDISGEPSENGYARKTIDASNDFSISLTGSGWQAVTPILSFTANGGNFGPIRNLFLTDASDNNGSLIATISLTSPTTVLDGNTINVRMAMTLTVC